MATKFTNHTGTVKWAKVYKGQEDSEYNCYSLAFYPDDVDEFTETGTQLQPKKDEDGTFFQLRRPVDKVIKGETVYFGPPEVFGPDTQPFNNLIGNGSKVTVRVAVYDYVYGKKQGKGTRLEAVMVNDWVEYKKEGETSSEPNKPRFPF